MLVGVTHHPANQPAPRGNGILSADCLSAFEKQVSPLLTDNSLILMEGWHYKVPIGPGHAKYTSFLTELPEQLGAQPTVGAFDPRYNEPRAKIDRGYVLNRQWVELGRRNVVFDETRIPRTYKELEESLRRGTAFEYHGPRTPQVIELAKWADIWHRRFDRSYQDALNRYGQRHDRCVVVAGTTHILSLASKTGFPVEILEEENPERILVIYRAYIIACLLPDLILQQRTAA